MILDSHTGDTQNNQCPEEGLLGYFWVIPERVPVLHVEILVGERQRWQWNVECQRAGGRIEGSRNRQSDSTLYSHPQIWLPSILWLLSSPTNLGYSVTYLPVQGNFAISSIPKNRLAFTLPAIWKRLWSMSTTSKLSSRQSWWRMVKIKLLQNSFLEPGSCRSAASQAIGFCCNAGCWHASYHVISSYFIFFSVGWNDAFETSSSPGGHHWGQISCGW